MKTWRLAPLSQMIVELFDWIGGPIEVDLLVPMVGYLLNVRDDRIESLTEQAAAGGTRIYQLILDTIWSASRDPSMVNAGS